MKINFIAAFIMIALFASCKEHPKPHGRYYLVLTGKSSIAESEVLSCMDSVNISHKSSCRCITHGDTIDVFNTVEK